MTVLDRREGQRVVGSSPAAAVDMAGEEDIP